MLLRGRTSPGWRRAPSATRLGVGPFQIAQTFASFSVVENVQLALLSHDRRTFQPVAARRRHRRDDALALLDQVGMEAQADRPAASWPTATSSAWSWPWPWPIDPQLLLMDEPTAGMAPASAWRSCS